MAKTKESTQLARLVPNSKGIIIDGQEVMVAANAEENSILNMVLAGQIRATIQEALKRYKDKDMLPNPKELKDLTDAASKMAEFSGTIYQNQKELIEGDRKEKPADRVEGKPDGVDFSKIAPVIDIKAEVVTK